MRRHVNLLIKKVSREELLESEDSFDFSIAEDKWLQGFQYALVEDDGWDPEDLEFTQLLFKGTKGDVIVDDIQSMINGVDDDEYNRALDAETFGVEKGSPLEKARRGLLSCMLCNTEYENVFAEEYAGSFDYHLGIPEKDIFMREECPYYSSLYLAEELGRKKWDYDTFIGFELWYDSMEIDDSHIVDMEVREEPDAEETVTVQRIARDYLPEISGDGEYEKMKLVGFGVCRAKKASK